MRTLTPKKVALTLFLALLGASYLGAFSFVEVHPILKTQVVLLPVQLGVLVYLLGWRRRKVI